jgi:hypothetical protein
MIAFREGFSHSEPGEQSSENLLQRRKPAPPDSYCLKDRQQKHLLDWLGFLTQRGRAGQRQPPDERNPGRT